MPSTLLEGIQVLAFACLYLPFVWFLELVRGFREELRQDELLCFWLIYCGFAGSIAATFGALFYFFAR